MEASDHENGADETQREVDERIDELTREGEEMEDRLEQAGSDAQDVEVPTPEEASGGGLGVSELTGDEGEDEGEEEDEGREDAGG